MADVTASCLAGVSATADASVISILQIKPPMGNVSFSLATICKIPVASAGSSKVALSDSTSAITSSSLTKSPSFLSQVEIVTSVIDSPTAGTFISFTPPLADGFDDSLFAGGAAEVAVAFAGGAVEVACAEGSISQMASPIGTVSPCCFKIFNTPPLDAGSSKDALSDSNSAITSST